MTCSRLPRSAMTPHRFAPRRYSQVDILAQQPLQHPSDVADHVVEIEDLGPHHLVASESEQLAGQRRGPFRGLGDLPRRRRMRRVGGKVRAHQLAVAGDHGQQVVEVVGDAAGEPAEGLELLRLMELRLEPGPLLLHALAIVELATQLLVRIGQGRRPLRDQPLEPQVARRQEPDGGAERQQPQCPDDEEAGRAIPGQEHDELEAGRCRIDVPVAIDGTHFERVRAGVEAARARRRPRSAAVTTPARRCARRRGADPAGCSSSGRGRRRSAGPRRSAAPAARWPLRRGTSRADRGRRRAHSG